MSNRSLCVTDPDACKHETIVPYGDGTMGRCTQCGDDTFPFVDDTVDLESQDATIDRLTVQINALKAEREAWESDGVISSECWELLRADIEDPNNESLSVVVGRVVAERDEFKGASTVDRIALKNALEERAEFRFLSRDLRQKLEAETKRADEAIDELEATIRMDAKD